MKTRVLNLNAAGIGQDRQGGAVLMVESLTVGSSVSITWLTPDGQRGTVANASPGRKYRPGFAFIGLEVEGAANEVVTLLIGDNPGADADVLDAVTVNNPAAAPVQVEIVSPIELTASSVTLTANGVVVSDAAPLPVEEQLATTLTDNAAVAVTAALTAVLALGARRGVRVYNQGPDAVALGGAALTWARRSIVLQMGDAWIEDTAPGALLNAICDAGTTATLGVQVLS